MADGPGLGNLTYTSAELTNAISRFTSTNGAPAGHGFVVMHRGYLTLVFSADAGGGNGTGGFSFYDVSNPRSPQLAFSTFTNASYGVGTTNYTGDIREAHAASFVGNLVCMPFNKTGGSGLQFWDWSQMDFPANPFKIGQITLPGLTGGDYAPTPWWVFWQGGHYVYVAGTSGGLYIVDATDPANPVLLDRGSSPNPIPTSQTGGFRINTVFAVGNLLVIAGSDVNGITTFDISDPGNPVLLATTTTDAVGYSMMVNGNRILGANDPARIWSITNPASITLIGVGPDVADKGGYGTFQDGFFQYGSSSKYVKLDIGSLPFKAVVTASPTGFVTPDWDFATPLGNLIFMGNDHSGSAIVPHQTSPDNNAPAVNMVVPADGATNQALTTRVGLTFTDMTDGRYVNSNTVIVRPIGGLPLTGKYSVQSGIVNFWPDNALLPNTTYEVVVPTGGVRDYVGNATTNSFISTFSTINLALPQVIITAQSSGPATNAQSVTFSVAAAGYLPFKYSWDFGDSSPPTAFSTDTNATHSYLQAGHYSVSVTASNELQQASALLLQTIHNPLTAASPTHSSTIILDANSNLVWNVNADSDTVTAIHAEALTNVLEKSVGKNPRTLAQAPDGNIWVANQADSTISILDHVTGIEAFAPIALPYGSHPYGIVFSPDGSAAFVSSQGAGRLLKIDPATRQMVGNIDVGPHPRGIAVSADSQRVFVTRFISPEARGEIVEVNPATMSITRTNALAIDPGPDLEDSGRGLPNYVTTVAISPDGHRAWIPSKKDNIQRGIVRDSDPLTFESTVRTIVSQIDLQSNTEDLSARVDFNDRDMANAICFSPLGDYVFVALQGNNAVDVLDAYNGDLITAIEMIGRAPQGVTLSADGNRLFVQNFMSRTVKVFDVSGIVASTNNIAPVLADISVVSNELLSPQVLQGKQIFYNAQDARMNLDRYISCASCHLDGGHDGRIWDFTDRGEGLRNTITLHGRGGMTHGRVHWSANFDEIQDFEHDIRGPFGGLGFMSNTDFNAGTRNQTLGDTKTGVSVELDALAAYVSSLTNTPPSPFRNSDGSMTADGVEGRAIFQSLNCASCHSGSRFTDSPSAFLHDVGTIKATSGQRLAQPLTGIDTPTLRGVWDTAPYFHDGSAATLMEVFNSTNGLHSDFTSSLNAAQKEQLVSYLLQIDDSEPLTSFSLYASGNAGSDFTISFQSDADVQYIADYTDVLSPPEWHPFLTNAGNGGVLVVTNLPMPSPGRYYRVRAE